LVRRTARSSVIASEAKQSRVFPRRQSGLLRYARNDEGVVRAFGPSLGVKSPNTYAANPARPSAGPTCRSTPSCRAR
jgi:hypothetical protein